MEENTHLTTVIHCPVCGEENEVNILDITNHETVSCNSCNKNFSLSDYDEDSRESIKKTQEAFKKLKELVDKKNTQK